MILRLTLHTDGLRIRPGFRRLHSLRRITFPSLTAGLCREHISRALLDDKIRLLIQLVQVITPVRRPRRHHRSQHRLHLPHLVIIVDKDHTSCQHRHREDPAGRPQDSGHMPSGIRLFFPNRHPLAEILNDLLVGPGLHPANIFPRHHVILHHLIPLIVDTVAL